MNIYKAMGSMCEACSQTEMSGCMVGCGNNNNIMIAWEDWDLHKTENASNFANSYKFVT